MISLPHPRVLLFVLGVIAGSPANAAYLATLAFTEPSGTVAPDESIPVWLTLTLDPVSDPLAVTLDGEADPPFGVPLANYPDFVATPLGGRQGLAYQLVSLDRVFAIQLNASISCGGTLLNNCAGSPYTFRFNRSGPDSPVLRPDDTWPELAVAAGASRDFLLGTLSPSGPVSPGNYTLVGAQMTLQFDARGTWLRQARDTNGVPLVDASGQPVFEASPVEAGAFGRLTLAETPCLSALPAAGCDAVFTRTVVPLPPAALLLLAAVAALPARRLAGGNQSPGPDEAKSGLASRS